MPRSHPVSYRYLRNGSRSFRSVPSVSFHVKNNVPTAPNLFALDTFQNIFLRPSPPFAPFTLFSFVFLSSFSLSPFLLPRSKIFLSLSTGYCLPACLPFVPLFSICFYFLIFYLLFLFSRLHTFVTFFLIFPLFFCVYFERFILYRFVKTCNGVKKTRRGTVVELFLTF